MNIDPTTFKTISDMCIAYVGDGVVHGPYSIAWDPKRVSLTWSGDRCEDPDAFAIDYDWLRQLVAPLGKEYDSVELDGGLLRIKGGGKTVQRHILAERPKTPTPPTPSGDIVVRVPHAALRSAAESCAKISDFLAVNIEDSELVFRCNDVGEEDHDPTHPTLVERVPVEVVQGEPLPLGGIYSCDYIKAFLKTVKCDEVTVTFSLNAPLFMETDRATFALGARVRDDA